MFFNGKTKMIEIFALIGAAVMLIMFFSVVGLAIFILLCLVFRNYKMESKMDEDHDSLDHFNDYEEDYDNPEIIEEDLIFDNYEILCHCTDLNCPMRLSDHIDRETFEYQRDQGIHKGKK